MKFLLFILTFFFISNSYAINKCVDSKGNITFTDKICKQGHKALTVKIRPINTMDSTSDKHAIYETQRQQSQTRNYYSNRTSTYSDKDSITTGNEERMRRMTSPLPNGLGTGRGCYKESNQYYCY